jgi:hypothetical protein
MRFFRRSGNLGKTIRVGGYLFEFAAVIEPDRNRAGKVQEYLPQREYVNKKRLSLHRYGSGPFCRFHIPSGFNKAGVYAITVGEKVVYIGECQNLSARYSETGYGSISPRNCFEGGQQTNCRINNLILQMARKRKLIELWFFETDDRMTVEAKLIQSLRPAWNR